MHSHCWGVAFYDVVAPTDFELMQAFFDFRPQGLARKLLCFRLKPKGKDAKPFIVASRRRRNYLHRLVEVIA